MRKSDKRRSTKKRKKALAAIDKRDAVQYNEGVKTNRKPDSERDKLRCRSPQKCENTKMRKTV